MSNSPIAPKSSAVRCSAKLGPIVPASRLARKCGLFAEYACVWRCMRTEEPASLHGEPRTICHMFPYGTELSGGIVAHATSIELDAYFSRIAYRASREPTLATLHAITAAHAAAIPFENLDVLLARPIHLDAETLQRKLVHERRGGYCFEQNGLLLLILQALGFQVVPISARARHQIPRDVVPPRTHVFLRVDLDDGSWLVDVGLGNLSLTSAIRLELVSEQSTGSFKPLVFRQFSPAGNKNS
jgi:hypothetical protein